MAVELAAGYVSLIPSFRGGAARITRELSGPTLTASRTVAQKSGSLFGKTFSKAASFGLAALKGGAFAGAAGLGFLGAIGLKTAADLEQAKISFTTLLGTGAKADKFLKDLKGFAAKTPFELPGLVSTARQLLGVGQRAKDVIPTLTAWGDTAGALGLSQEQFNRTMLAVTQSMAKGKIQAEELMQITEAGVPIWSIMSKALKKPIPELQKLSSEGKLLAKDVWPKVQAEMNKEFGGSMAKQSKTLAGLWSTFMDTLKIGLADAIQPLIPVLKDSLPGAMKLLGGGLRVLGSVLKIAVTGFSALMAAFREGDVTSDGIIGVFERIGVAIRNVVGFFKGIVSSFRSANGEGAKLSDSLSGILGSFAPLVPIVKDFAQKAIAILVPGLKQIWQVLQNNLLPALNRFLPVIMPVVAFLLKFVGSALLGALKGALQFIKGFFQAIAGLLDIFTGLFTGDWKRLWIGVKTLAKGLWNAILGAFKVFLNLGMIRLFRLGLSVLRIVWSAGWALLKRLAARGIANLLAVIRTGFGNLLRLFRSLPGKILSALAIFGSLLVSKGRDLLSGLLRGIKAYYTNLFSWFRSLPRRILGTLGDMGRVLYDAGVALVRGFLNGIKSMAGAAADAAKGVVSGAINGAKHLLHLGSPSKLFHQFGVWTMEGYVQGLDAMGKKTERAMADALGVSPGQARLGLGGVRTNTANAVNMLHADITIDGAQDPTATAKQVRAELLKLRRDLGGGKFDF